MKKKTNPPYPFITSSIQQELSNLYHLSSKSSMNILQKLYESGKITYIRTDSYNISRFFSPDFDTLLIKTLKNNSFDVIHLESLFMTPYVHTLRKYSSAKVILRSHNLEYMIWERLARKTINPAKKIYLNILSKQLKNYETSVLNSIDGIAAISMDDRLKYEKLGCEKPMKTIPFGIDIKKYHHKHNH